MNLYKSLLLGRFLNRINSDIERSGVPLTMAKIIQKTGTKLIIDGKNKKTISILKNNPVILAANHPSEADVLILLAALEERKDNNLIINSIFTKVLPNLDKNLIPVHINSRLMEKNKFNIRLRLLKKLHNTETLMAVDEHKKNIESINNAIEKLNQGGLVAIFPGGGGEKGKWFSGVGYLAKGVKNLNKTYFINAYIEGTSIWDFLRIIPFVSKLMPPFKISIDEPKTIKHLQLLGPKEASLVLESEYNSWTNKLLKEDMKPSFWEKLVLPQKSYLFVRSLFVWILTKIN
jgi:hypothetical protein